MEMMIHVWQLLVAAVASGVLQCHQQEQQQ
jgi:hypothetical protein